MSGSTSLDSYLSDVSREPQVDPTRERDLARRARAGDLAARDELARANLRFVVYVAKRFRGRGLPLEDLIAEGNVGLMKAIDRFDPERGFRFTTYSSWWIRQSIGRALAYAPAVRVPKHAPAEAVPTRLSDDARDAALRHADVDMRSNGVAERDERAWVCSVVGRLAAREQEIVRLRFGLDGGAPWTLRRIGDRVGLTRERVRQILNETFDALAASSGPLDETGAELARCG